MYRSKIYAVLTHFWLRYLNDFPDTAQYPAARCKMSDTACMYGRSASSGLESMNRANMRARDKSAVDIVNATLLILKMERKRFIAKQELAWQSDEVLTVKGRWFMKEVFDEISVADYEISEVEFADYTLFTVKKSGTNSPDGKVKIPNQPFKGSRFGSCSCGAPKVLGIPCEHMAAVVQAGYSDLTQTNIMPFWWTIAELRLQYPMTESNPERITLEYVINSGIADHNLRYCPALAAAQKTGRPKKGKRIKGAAERNSKKSKSS